MRKAIKNLETIDIVFFTFLSTKLSKRYMQSCATFLSTFGNGVFYVFFFPIFFYLWKPHEFSRYYFVALGAVILEKTIYAVTKRVFKRNRPPVRLQGVSQLIQPPDEFSFPSGHTSTAFCLATTMSYYCPSYSLLFYTLSTLIGLSRIVLRVHFPLDVIVGAVIGVSCSHFVTVSFF